MKREILCCRMFCECLLVAAAAQDQAGQAPLLRSTTRLVQVEVIARDKAGRPVAGLGQDDFAVRTTVGLFQFDAQGRELANLKDDIDFKLDPARAELLSRHGISYSRKVALDPSAVKLKLVVHSHRTGALGSITIPVVR